MATEAAITDSKVPAQSRLGGDFLEGFSSLNLLRQIGLIITLAASVAIGFAVVMWMQGDDYRPLYGRMDNLDAANVIDVLDQHKIKFKMDTNTGAILVAADDVHMARLKLAEFGLPSSPVAGFELMDKEQPLGTSQFVENTRYQRSIEGELARTITSITSIRSARVHLAMPKKTVFVRDAAKPTASVFVEVFAGRTVAPAQVKAIMNLVASSVPDMKMENVTVVDQHGSLLSTGEESSDLLLATRQHQYAKEVETSVIQRINSILEPVVGDGKFRAQVNADIDFTAVEQAAETFNPDLPAIRSEQTLNESRTGSELAGGIPGALTNQPPGTAAQAPEQIDPATGQPIQQQPPKNNREQATRNYELDRTISYTKHQQGTLKRLTVAVVVDDKVVRNAEGVETRVPWTDAELERLSILVRDAVGFSAVRGDSVNVLNSPFSGIDASVQTQVEDAMPWWQQWIMANIKYLAGILVILIVVFGLLRPLFKSLSRTGSSIADEEEARELAALEAAGAGKLDGISDETVTLTGGSAFMLPGPEQGYEEQINAIKGLIADDPGRVAQVVKKWINRDD
ncbi:flagellar basal-body MS-ring/collar protein FliF [Cellvibrio japonicus]|uniref:Flagellar M-ring protein n=1 Tax=Cellvibrio japonicus (strain Ueda107) TaxID=498211 RepID=B3PEY7_CELJU|nr:flagellar basal-body MS-ring/collar protein FliF [Cellvibrio japonicus]ACE83465.1 flagellar M-ring protein FliF [Cellvibrio japonicus Ueda107]QEI12233.1 flagellar basal body M-ring protein FliF [Cellvibrio japonicus]QEI15807.1 flagellar basal body M-ring protein FliF [Cellvibrio japonicus]QEI19385.1 flagellar basal body M-ring protein FliF [Cellvibrio japonicus]